MRRDSELVCNSQDVARPKIRRKTALSEHIGRQKKFFRRRIAKPLLSFILKLGGRESNSAIAHEVRVLDSAFLCCPHEDDMGEFVAQREATSNEGSP